MSEFKFSCPHCQQSIQATPEYSGVQINCPSCQTAIVVPDAPAAASPPGAPKAGPGKLTKAPSTVQHIATSPVMAAATVRHAKKPRIKLYVGLGVGTAVAVAAIMFVPKLLDKYNEHKAAVAAAQEALTNPPPPPPPPELEAGEVLKKVGEVYKAFPSYSVQGVSLATIDMSAISPMYKTPQMLTTKLSLRLGRPEYYRMEWEQDIAPQKVNKGAAWSAGKGDFVHVGTTTTKVRNLEAGLAAAGASSGSLGSWTAALFFNESNNLADVLKNVAKTNSETLDGQKCYVLTGQIAFQNALLWVHKSDFLIAQAELVLGGKIDDSMLAGLTPVQKNQLEKAAKIRGNYIETYQSIETNKTLNPNDFESSFPPNAVIKPKEPKAGGRKERGKPQ
jgi:hypothetical protein